MTVEQTNVVDAIGLDNDSGVVVLTISDHLEWSSDEHLLKLQAKLNKYVSFVESGEILTSYPDAKGRNVLIAILCKYAPDERGIDFLNHVSDIVDRAGMRLTYQMFSAN